MNCKFCNGPLEGDEIKCPYCGELLKEESVQQEESVYQESVCEESTCDCGEMQCACPEENPKKKGFKTGLIIGVCVLLAAIVAGAVMYALGVGPFAKGSEVARRENYTFTGEVTDALGQKVVATAGGRELTNSELQLYYWYGVNNFVSYYSQYLEALGLNVTLPLEDQVYDKETGETWQHFFLNNALDSWHRSVTMELQAQKANHKLDEESQNIVDTMPQQLDMMATQYNFENAQQMIQSDFGPLSSADGYMNYIKTSMVGNSYFATLYDGIVPTQAEVEAHYESNASKFEEMGAGKEAGKTVDVRHILFTPEQTTNEDGTTTITEEQWETCREKAQALLDEYLAGEVTEDAFAQLAVEHSEDPGSAANGGLYTGVYVGQMVEPFENWCFDESRKIGDTGLVKTTYGYHIMYFVADQEIWLATAQSDLVNMRTEELVQVGITQWPMKVNYKAIALCDPKAAETESATPTTEVPVTE